MVRTDLSTAVRHDGNRIDRIRVFRWPSWSVTISKNVITFKGIYLPYRFFFFLKEKERKKHFSLRKKKKECIYKFFQYFFFFFSFFFFFLYIFWYYFGPRPCKTVQYNNTRRNNILLNFVHHHHWWRITIQTVWQFLCFCLFICLFLGGRGEGEAANKFKKS